ncbi:hypothetical protein PsorP6_010695 [Peronosclerospora sorghi]|uniref:Uncharacterized protein n=1 Tax=Peronosclerospora sorghi TaxID=230839 RepID=A0ACC0VY71_9STRA|nr:hypothetical protein PsorP6_010695 [Peronosclerospora sorghi]
MPLQKASMLEKETLVIFDEARSRGSDMKLLPDAAAVTDNTKEKTWEYPKIFAAKSVQDLVRVVEVPEFYLSKGFSKRVGEDGLDEVSSFRNGKFLCDRQDSDSLARHEDVFNV